MEALRKKWNSSRGASILLALLFLLVCMMVGASVLMAAASNAGKIRSNREEQQKYFTLSSALTLLCDEIQEAEYVGRYKYGYVEVGHWENKGTSEHPDWQWIHEYDRHYYWRETGALRKKGTGTNATNPAVDWELKELLPLYNDLDQIFADFFAVPSSEQNPGDEYQYTALNNIIDKTPRTVTVSSTNEAFADVTIVAKMNSAGAITLTATFTDADTDPKKSGYIMEARLTPKEGHPRNVILLSGNLPGPCFGRTGDGPVDPSEANATQYETEKSLTWELEYIVKKEAPVKEGGTP